MQIVSIMAAFFDTAAAFFSGVHPTSRQLREAEARRGGGRHE